SRKRRLVDRPHHPPGAVRQARRRPPRQGPADPRRTEGGRRQRPDQFPDVLAGTGRAGPQRDRAARGMARVAAAARRRGRVTFPCPDLHENHTLTKRVDMNDTQTGTAGHTYGPDELAWFAEHYADTDWIVHVIGPDEIHTNAN